MKEKNKKEQTKKILLNDIPGIFQMNPKLIEIYGNI